MGGSKAGDGAAMSEMLVLVLVPVRALVGVSVLVLVVDDRRLGETGADSSLLRLLFIEGWLGPQYEENRVLIYRSEVGKRAIRTTFTKASVSGKQKDKESRGPK